MLLAFLLANPLSAQQNAPAPGLSPAAVKIRERVNAIPMGGKLTVRKVDGTEFHGNLQAIDASTFSVREVDLRTVVTVAYEDVDRVSKNYGGKGFGGRRVNPKKSLIVGIVVVGALLALVFVAVANDKS